MWLRCGRGAGEACVDLSRSGYTRSKAARPAQPARPCFPVRAPFGSAVEWPAPGSPGSSFVASRNLWQSPADGLCVEMWINIRELPPKPKGRALLLLKPGVFWLSINARGMIGGGIRLHARPKQYPYFDFAAPYTRLPINEWLHVATSYDAKTRTTAYFLNGKRIYKRAATRRDDYRFRHFNEKSLNAPITIGRGFVGAIGEVKVWDHAKTRFDLPKLPKNDAMEETRIE